MKLEKFFKAAVDELTRRKIPFAVAGGFAAAIYRKEPRLTMDVDITILPERNASDTAVAVIESIGLHAGIARKADLAGGPLFAIRRGKTEPCMIIGRPDGSQTGEGVDILLPAIPWVEDAVQRAQNNKMDFGFGVVPVLTVEDVILAKLYALNAASLRVKDMDDLQSIFEADRHPDMSYIAGRMQCMEIVVPHKAEPFLPDILLKLSRNIARSRKKKRR